MKGIVLFSLHFLHASLRPGDIVTVAQKLTVQAVDDKKSPRYRCISATGMWCDIHSDNLWIIQ